MGCIGGFDLGSCRAVFIQIEKIAHSPTFL
jgi:hypothetical protein